MFYAPVPITSTGRVNGPGLLSKPQLNHNLTQPQPNKTLVGLDTKMTLHPPPHPQKLNASNISAVADPILMKL